MTRAASLLGGVLCLAASVGVAFGGWYRPALTPRVAEGLVVNPPVHDFGTVSQGDTLPAEFVVTNNYRRPVVLTELTKHCSCVQPTAAKTTLAPGESTTIQVGYRTLGKRGRVSETLGILYQVGAELAVQNYGLRAEVVPDVVAVPEEVRSGGDRLREQVVTLKFRDPAIGLKVAKAYCSAEAVATTLSADGQSVTVSYDPSVRVATGLDHKLFIRLTGGMQQWIEVPVQFANPD
jgi:hypothetical protein